MQNAAEELHAGNREPATCRGLARFAVALHQGSGHASLMRASQLKGKRYSRSGYRSLLLIWDYDNKHPIVSSQAHNDFPQREVNELLS